jgi:hypothetical protein
LEASPEELEQKGHALIKALAAEVRLYAPDLAESLEKALPPPDQVLKYPVLQQLADKTREEYARALERMVGEIGKVLDQSTKADARYIEKADSDVDQFEKAMAGPFIGPRGGKWADPAHTVPWHPGLGTPEQIAAAPAIGRRTSEAPPPVWAADRGPWKTEAFSFPEGTESHPLKTVALSELPEDWWKGSSYDIRDHLKKIIGEVKAPAGFEVVYRVASGPTGLSKKNAGNLEAVTEFLMNVEEKGIEHGDKITAYVVKLPEQFSTYKEMQGKQFRGTEAVQKPEAPKVDTASLLEGNFGIPRIDMPQIKSTLVPDFIEGLRKKGIDVERGSIRVSNLKATQAEIHVDKVQKLIDDPAAHEHLKKPVMVSKDGYILDGHHRWAALRTIDPDESMGAVKIGLPIKELLAEAKQFHAVEFKKAEEEHEGFYDYTFDVFDRDDRAYNRVKKVLQTKGFLEADFDEGGALYGWSVNQLIELTQSDLLKSGQLFIGPRGGKWADAQHTIPWHEHIKPRAVASVPVKTTGKRSEPFLDTTSEWYSFRGEQHGRVVEQLDIDAVLKEVDFGNKRKLLNALTAATSGIKAGPGEMIVYRVGKGSGTSLENRNAANIAGIAHFINNESENADEDEVSVTSNKQLVAYAVPRPQEFAEYTLFRNGAAVGGPYEKDTRVVAVRTELLDFREDLMSKLPSGLELAVPGTGTPHLPWNSPDSKPRVYVPSPVGIVTDIWADLEVLEDVHAREDAKARTRTKIEAEVAAWDAWHEKYGKDFPVVPRNLPESTAQVLDESLKKSGGPFIGPRGGKWADSEHTQSWRPDEVKSALEAAIVHHGGKVTPHHTDPSKVVVKIPVHQAQVLGMIKQKYNLSDEIKLGEKYAILPVPKAVFHGVQAKAKVKAQPKLKTPQEDKPKYVSMVSTKPLVPPYSKSEWKPHKTVDEAKAWAKEQGIDVAYSDLETANAVNRAISEQHPWIKKHAEFLGSEAQLRTWAKEHPDINKRSMTEAKHPIDLSEFSLGGNATAIAVPTTKKPYSQSVVVVSNSRATADTYPPQAKGWPIYSHANTMTDVLCHEFGHVEGFIFRHLYPSGKEGLSAWEIWKKHCVPQLKKFVPKGKDFMTHMLPPSTKSVAGQISVYGATNPHECWAEVSVMRRRGMALPDWVHAAVAEMKIDTVPWDQMGEIWSKP